MAKKLTSLAVENATPSSTRIEIPDGGNTGLYLVIQPSGAKSWAVRYRYLGKPRKLTLGSVLTLQKGDREPEKPKIGDPLTLAAAHMLAKDALHKLRQGKDPASDKQQAIISANVAAIDRAADSVENIAQRFIKLHVEKKNRASTKDQVERILNREVLPVWSGNSVHDIKKKMVVALLHDIAENRPVLANRTHAVLRKWFNWMNAEDILTTLSPCKGVVPPANEKSRERVLSEFEIGSLWKACDEVGPPFGPYAKLVILTAQRRSEVAGMRWSEIDVDRMLWTLPGERTKNGVIHIVPISSQAWGVIESLPRIKNGKEDSDFVISTTGTSGLSGFSRAKKRFDEIMKTREPWTYHDLRRTAVTLMADDLAVLPHVVEAVVNHITGHKTGVAGVYNRATYAVEKRAALDKWADYIDAIVAGKPVAKVVRFPERRRG